MYSDDNIAVSGVAAKLRARARESSEPENKVIVVDPRTAELLFTFTNDEKMLSITFTVEKRYKQSEVYALLVMSANKLQSYKQEDKRTTFTASKLIAQNKQGKFPC